MMTQEQLQAITEKYRTDPELYTQEYLKALDNLSIIHEQNNKFLDSIMLREKAIRVIEYDYIKNKKQWAVELSNNLKKLSTLYKRCSLIEESRNLDEKAKLVLEDKADLLYSKYLKEDFFSE